MVRASISVFSEAKKPDVLSAEIGLDYDSAWTAGDLYPGKGAIAGRRRKENCWRISVEVGDDANVVDPVMKALQEVLLRVKGLEDRFKGLRRQDCEIELSIYTIGEHIPAIGLGLSELSGIVALGAYLDVDIVLSK